MDYFREALFQFRQKWSGRFLLRSAPRVKICSAETDFYSVILETFRHKWSELFFVPDVVVDIGCRNWSYLRAINLFFLKSKIFGLELDGGRRFLSLHTRSQVARAYVQEECKISSKEIVFLHQDFRDFSLQDFKVSPESVGFIFLYPFVSKNPCVRWGLPTRFSLFDPLLERAFQLAIKEASSNLGWIASVHQGEWEAEAARGAYQNLMNRHGLSKELLKETLVPTSAMPQSFGMPYDAMLFFLRLERP